VIILGLFGCLFGLLLPFVFTVYLRMHDDALIRESSDVGEAQGIRDRCPPAGSRSGDHVGARGNLGQGPLKLTIKQAKDNQLFY